MTFKKVNNLTGWIVCIIACLVYILTAERSGSFWDVGEFTAAAYKLQLPHPPGAPVFTLIGRFFIILFGDDPMTAARAVNTMSAVASGFTILFLFWTITHFGRKLMTGFYEEPTINQTFTIMGAGIVGALAYTFSDSFWFSAVEGEVYALSSFFTALVFWAMLKWERADVLAENDAIERSRADRWIVFIAFMMGLSIGVHLLNLLTIPAMVMIYYYRRYAYTTRGAITAFVLGCVIVGFVQLVMIQYTVKGAGAFDILFVNGFGMPFFSGFTFYFLALAALIYFGLQFKEASFNKQRFTTWSVLFLLLILLPFFTQKEFGLGTLLRIALVVGLGLLANFAGPGSLKFLRLGLWCFIFVLIGYSPYITTMERSSANPAMDMNNVDNPMSLNYYLGREQYGSAPLIYGPHFQAKYKRMEDGNVEMENGEMKYSKGADSYVPIGRQQEPKYQSSDMQLFPRVWDRSNDQGHADAYARWLNLERVQDPETGEQGYEAPTYGDNINWFMTYQMGFMYWRYFMWNFAGKQNDIQGFGNKRDGNWISGINFIDNARLGDQAMIPESLKQNKANNKLFLIPLILGIFGCIYHFLRDRRDWIVSFLLFFFTGLAIVLYLNQPGSQPRERDYAYAGSFYAFSIWIGLSVIGFVKLARERMNEGYALRQTLMYGSAAAFLLTLMSNPNVTFGGALLSSILVAVVYALVVGIIYFVTRAVSGMNRMSGILAFLLCMSAPIIMAANEWDDHDRSRKTLAPALARNYLESCAPNAILFTFGDNDTYPLWYAQEVEGVRPDIRIINTSLLGIDWYVNQLRYKVNESAPIDVVWSAEQVRGVSYIVFRPEGDPNRPVDLMDMMKNKVGPMLNTEDKTNIQATFPSRRFLVNVDTAALRANGTAGIADSLYGQVQFDLPEGRSYLTLDQLTILNIIAANGWKRPIYFTSPYTELGFGPYLRKDGMTYRVVPVKVDAPQQNWIVDQALRGSSIRSNNTDTMYANIMEHFGTGGANKTNVYFDEENRRHLLSIRSTFAEAAGNMADKGRKAEANNLLNRAESLINPASLPYAMVGRFNANNQTAMMYLEAAYKAGNTALAAKLKAAIQKDLNDQKAYYDYMKTENEALFSGLEDEENVNNFLLQLLPEIERRYATAETPPIVVEQPRRDTGRGQNP